MGFVAVLAAAAASWIFGAIWYGIVAEPWKKASGVPLGDDGKPLAAKKAAPYITSLVSAVLVAGMMRHAFVLSGIDTIGEGIVTGFGIGLFFATPWIATNYGFSDRPMALTAIDGAYATVGCTLMGLVLTLF